MSSRNIRKLMAEKEQRERDKKNEEEKENEEPDEEYSPHFVQMNPAFEGLEISSDSESELSVLSEPPYQDEAAAVIPEEDKYGAKKKTFTNNDNENKNKKKKRKNKKDNKKPDEVDEIEWSLQQVNRMLGSPPAKQEEVIVDKMVLEEKRLFSIHPNNINVNYELGKVFGEEERVRRVRNGTRRMRHEIGLSPDVHPFRVKGLTMTRYKTEGNIKYFKFTHTQDYKTRCQALVEQMKMMLFVQVRRENNLHSENCVEALLENCDFLYYVEEHKGANQALEQAIYFMQSVGEPSFNFVDGKTRLEYEFVENRPFHIAILKYLHVLTNIACHRTALELAKVLINLDPTDPLAVIFIIDTLAIRAREHQWLLDLIEFWREKRQPQRLFHMRYSRALALFHVACKKKDYDGIDMASNALMKAVKYFPPVAVKIMEFSKMSIPDEIKNHEIFVPPANVPVSHELDELMALYAWLIGPRWREPQVWKWFMETLTDLIDLYDRNPEMEEEVRQSARLRAQVYRRIPTQLKRHLYAIRPMAKYISDGRMPHTNLSVSFNPFPCEGSSIDTYNYFSEWAQQYAPAENALMALIQGIYPDMYQLGRRNMNEMLERMDGMEIIVNHGSYLVVGPRVYRPGEDDGLRTYRVVFLRRPPSPAPGEGGPERDPVEELRVAVEEHGGAGVLLNGLGIDFDDDDGVPLLNRLNLNDAEPDQAHEPDPAHEVEPEYDPNRAYGPNGAYDPYAYQLEEDYYPNGAYNPNGAYYLNRAYVPEGEYYPNIPYGPEGDYYPNGAHDPHGAYDPNRAPGPEEEYIPQGAYGPNGVYDPHGAYGPDGAYGPHEAYGPHGAYGPDGAYGPHEAYGLQGAYGPRQAYDPIRAHTPEGEYDPNGVDDPNRAHAAEGEYDPNGVDDPNRAHAAEGEYDPNGVDDPNRAHAAEGEYDPNGVDDPNRAYAAEGEYDPNGVDDPNRAYAAEREYDPNGVDDPNRAHAAEGEYDPNGVDDPNRAHAAEGEYGPNGVDDPNRAHAAEGEYDPNGVDDPNRAYAAEGEYDPNGVDDPNRAYAAEGEYDPNGVDDPNRAYAAEGEYDPNGVDDPNRAYAAEGEYDPNGVDDPNRAYAAEGEYDPNGVDDPNRAYAAEGEYDPNGIHDPNRAHAPEGEYDPHGVYYLNRAPRPVGAYNAYWAYGPYGAYFVHRSYYPYRAYVPNLYQPNLQREPGWAIWAYEPDWSYGPPTPEPRDEELGWDQPDH